jgi:hypothetical protein
MDLYKGMDQLRDLTKLYMDMKNPQVQEETAAPEQVDEKTLLLWRNPQSRRPIRLLMQSRKKKLMSKKASTSKVLAASRHAVMPSKQRRIRRVLLAETVV